MYVLLVLICSIILTPVIISRFFDEGFNVPIFLAHHVSFISGDFFALETYTESYLVFTTMGILSISFYAWITSGNWSAFKKRTDIDDVYNSSFANKKDINDSAIVEFGNDGIPIGFLKSPDKLAKIISKSQKAESRIKGNADRKRLGKNVSERRMKAINREEKKAISKVRKVASTQAATVFNQKNSCVVIKQPLSLICFAPPGTGKTAGLIIPLCFMLKKRSAMILDVKGEIFGTTSKDRAKFGNVQVFSPVQAGHRWNPIDWTIVSKMTPDQVITMIDRLVTTLVPDEGDKKGDYFALTGKNLVKTTFLLVIMESMIANNTKKFPTGYLFSELENYINKYGFSEDNKGASPEYKVYEENINRFLDGRDSEEFRNPSIGRVATYELVQDSLKMYTGFFLYILKSSENSNLVYGEMLSQADKNVREFSDMADNQYSGVMGTAITALSAYTNPVVMFNLSKNEIDFEKLYNETLTIYLVIPAEDLTTYSTLIAAFLESFANFSLSRKPKQGDNRIILGIDEFPRLGKMEVLLGMPALSRGQGVSLIFIAQNPGQIASTYGGKEKVSVIIGTTAAKIFLTQNDHESAKEMSESAGKRMVMKESGSRDKETIGVKKSGRDLVEVPLITATELMSIPFGKHFAQIQNMGSKSLELATPLWFLNQEWINRSGSIDLLKKLREDNVPPMPEKKVLSNQD